MNFTWLKQRAVRDGRVDNEQCFTRGADQVDFLAFFFPANQVHHVPASGSSNFVGYFVHYAEGFTPIGGSAFGAALTESCAKLPPKMYE